jgi:uncharacterized protein
MENTIDYGSLMHDAMRGLIQRVLQDLAKTGELPGDHHFFITFDTNHPNVDVADWLSDRYPNEMTVVIQHWFDNLEVTDEGFLITLNFGDQPEPLYIPYMALRSFVDPSVEFGLSLGMHEKEIETDAVVDTLPMAEAPMHADANTEDTLKPAAEVVSLDSFRKP